MSEEKNNKLHNLIVRPIKLEEKKLWQELMAKHHYLGDAQLAGESIRYVAILEDKLVALIGWSWPSLKNHNREKWIGWSEELKMKRLRFIVNNTRFLILPWIKIKHLASKILALNVRRLSSDWEIIYDHPVLLVETFVDESRFKGTCYKAAGWQYLGKTRGFARHRNGYISHGNCKLVFIQPLRKKTKEILSAPFTHPVLVTKKGGVMDINKLPLEGKGGLIDFLKKVPDPRGRQGVRHKLKPLLVVIVCACLAGARSYAAIAQWVQSLPMEILLQLGFRMGKPPSETGIRRFMKKLDAQKTDEIINGWLLTFGPNLEGKAIAIDGKTLRGAYEKNKTLPHLISAVLHKEGIVIAQKAVGEKTNEIPELKNLIEDINIKGSVVTADAIHTQTDTAKFIVKEKEADYVFTVKDNQSALKKEIKRFDFEAFSPEARNS